MKPVLVIALHAIRSAARSKVIVILLALLAAAIVGLPLTMKGDGTITGHVQVVLRYTLGLSSLILSVATLWAGCAAISTEVHERQIHMVLSKPVHRFQVWLGKWLGLVLLNALLLSVSGAMIYGLLLWSVRPSQLNANDAPILKEEILIARRPLDATPVHVEDEAHRTLDRQVAKGAIPPEADPEDVLKAIRAHLLRQAFTVEPGGSRTWEFPVPDTLRNHPILFRFKLAASNVGSTSTAGRWALQTEGVESDHSVDVVSVPNRVMSFMLPVEYIRPGKTLSVTYENLDEKHTVIFPHEDGLVAYLYEGGFTANFLRVMLLVFCQLAFLAAVGVSAGTLFSMSVAALVAVYVLIVVQAGSYIITVAEQPGPLQSAKHSHHHGPVEEVEPPGLFAYAVKDMYVGLGTVLAPLEEPDTPTWLANGRLVPWTLVGRIVLIKFLLYSGIMGLLSSWIFKKREVGLPL